MAGVSRRQATIPTAFSRLAWSSCDAAARPGLPGSSHSSTSSTTDQRRSAPIAATVAGGRNSSSRIAFGTGTSESAGTFDPGAVSKNDVRLGWLFAVCIAIGVVALSRPADACSCANWDETSRRTEFADAVFVGTVERIDVPWVMRPAVAEAFLHFPLALAYVVDHQIRVRFDVEQRFKGALGRQVWVNTGDFPGFDCEDPNVFSESSERWLVFANERSDGELHVGTCMYPVGEQERPEEFARRIRELPTPSATPHVAAAWSTYHGRAPWRTGAVLVGLSVLLLWIRRRALTGRSHDGRSPKTGSRSEP